MPGLRRKAVPPPARQRAQTRTVIAPIKGWRSDKSAATEQPGAALKLLNFVPESDAIRLRRGYQEHMTGIGDAIETLMVYNSGSISKMFAAADDSIFDVSGGGSVGAAVVSSLTSARWSWTNMTTTGGQFLVLANGEDNVQQYNGSVWSEPTITGPAAESDLKYVWQHKGRLWFIEKTSTSAWYLPVDSIAGAATEFNIGSLFSRGGRLIAGATWSIDAGDGMDDLNVFLTSEGQVAIYSMIDPGDSTTLFLVGVYYVGKPIGDRPLFQLGGELLVITYSGIVPLSKALKVSESALELGAVTAPIRRSYADTARLNGAKLGWQMVTYPRSNIAILNIPTTENVTSEQYVVNILTGAWAQWNGINALCWALFDEELYFGGPDGTVYLAETGSADNGAVIDAELIMAFSQMGANSRLKMINLVRPNIESNLSVAGTTRIIADYEAPWSTTDNSTATGSLNAFTWDVSVWDGTDLWAGSSIIRSWRAGGSIGTALAIHHVISAESETPADDLTFRIFSYDVVLETGGVL